MKLVIIPDVDGPSMAIIDENFPPENYVDIDRCRRAAFDVLSFDTFQLKILFFRKRVYGDLRLRSARYPL